MENQEFIIISVNKVIWCNRKFSYKNYINLFGGLAVSLEERRAALCIRFIQWVDKTCPLYNLIRDQHCQTTCQYNLRTVVPKIRRCNTDRFKQFVTVKYSHHLMCNWTKFTYMYISIIGSNYCIYIYLFINCNKCIMYMLTSTDPFL